MNSFFCLFITLQSPIGFAGTILDYKPLIMGINAGDRLVVHGFEGSVKIIGRSGKTNEIEFRLKQENPEKLNPDAKNVLDEWNFSLQRKGDTIEAVVRSPQNKSVWPQLLNGGIPQFHLEIYSPSIPIFVSWRKGIVTTEGWNSSIAASLLNGILKVRGGKGETHLQNGEGEINLNNREGNIFIDAFNTRLKASDLKGKMEVENFSGETQLINLDGFVSLMTTSGRANLNNIKGRLDFSNLRAHLVIDQFEGELRGQNGAGSVTTNIIGEADVHIQSKEGPINIDLSHSAANLNLSSTEGQIFVPSYLKVSRLTNSKWVRGKLRGDIKGSVVVRSTEGHIRIK